jgi:hypothetical protein
VRWRHADAPDALPVRGALPVSFLFALATSALAAGGLAGTLTLDFDPGFEPLATDVAFHGAFWLHGALVAAGSLRLRPREGRESFASNYLAFLSGQGLVSLLLWIARLESLWSGTGRLSAAVPFLPSLALALWAAGPLVAVMALFRVRQSGLVLAGQIAPVWFAVFALVLGESRA